MVNPPKYTSDQLYMFDGVPTSVLINVDNGEGGLQYAYSNPFMAESLGYEPDEFRELLKKHCFAAIYEPDWEKTKSARTFVLAKGVTDSISRQKCKDGSVIWVLAHIRLIELDGKSGMLFLFSKIQELIGLQNDLSAKNKASTEIFENIPVGLLVYKEEGGLRTTLSINRNLVAFANAVGRQLDSKHRDWNDAEFAMILNQDIYAFTEEEDIPIVRAMLENKDNKPVTDCVFRLRGSSVGNPVFIHCTCATKKSSPTCTMFYVTYQNVTEEENRRIELVEKQNQLYKLSYFDSMTGVKNRNAYNKYVDFCRNNRLYNVGFVFCDLNGLKQTNDTLGHYYGDRMIRLFASILLEFFSESMIYRLSGDEFVIIDPDVDHEDFKDIMDKLILRIKSEDEIASVGFVWKESASDIQYRITQAEQIMYVEKQKYYEATKAVNSKHRPHMLGELLKEFEDNRFVMYLQPKTSIDSAKVIGAEALARKYDKDGNIISPYGFVPQLEAERLIPKLDFFMLDQACRFLENEHRAGNDDFSISVNLSRVTIVENELMETVAGIMDKYDFNHKNLEFELTESNKTMDDVRLEEYLVKLKALGVKLSIDDMGNDYSTLSLLTLDGFDWVKLDRSLVIQMENPKARVLVKHIIHTCHDLNLKVIAEGVETDDVREVLQDMSCDAYQGYLKSKPIPAGEFKKKFL